MAKALREAKARAPKMADASKEPSGPTAASVAPGPDAPSSGAATGTNSTDDPPESDDQGGAGNGAGSAGSALDGIDLGTLRPDAEAEFRAKFPRFSAAMEAWQAEHESGEVPTGLRIKAKKDGFRRGGIAHPKSPVDHPVETFTSPEQLEAIFAEPNLVVELI
ncbi:hypothetical protein EOA37_09665 [Mesorhizobium sp. M2A.F.Ca.ET.015.02.1.1]|uniref:HI1506-related protein n=1 Tax=Mesorhizobium sp. M2A.F.Ca.ET.015.02.1.1 TaxID=2496758 RepID=UPI000FCB28EC|nr:HI1506-related protein [Mesorhizobium sp. M2A.F.Ca.ET.015.02.1.1]RUW41518.1 hypothetical protein EOA37_09665 [Mesorhizobium sp. M2A.F.Ca.ET.015.02.1.1]